MLSSFVNKKNSLRHTVTLLEFLFFCQKNSNQTEMADYKRTELKRFPAISARKSSEYRYWKKFKNPILVKEYAAVNAIHFSPVSPYEFAVTSSTRVQIYSSKSNTVTKTISRFRDTAYSGSIRNDGKLAVAGDASGLVQVFDVNSRAILRSLHGHQE